MLTPSSTIPTVKIGIYRSTSIGDVVLATACLDLLRSLSIPFEVTWIGRSPSLQLISSAFPEIKIVEVHSEVPNYQDVVVEELRHVHFLIDLQMSLRSRLICRDLQRSHRIPIYGCEKNTIGRGKMVLSARIRGRRRSLPESIQRVERFQFEMMLDTLKKALISHLPIEKIDGLEKRTSFPFLDTSHDTGQKPWQKELKFGDWLAIAPGAAHPTKKAPQDMFIDILDRIRQHLRMAERPEKSMGLLFVGSEAEREEALSIADTLGWQGPVLNLAGKLTLWESALALKEVLYTISNDSSLAHISEAVGTPCGVLFGPTVEAFGFVPWRRESKAFSAPLGCRPCSKHGKVNCRYNDMLCFKLLSPGHIAAYIWDMMQVHSPELAEQGTS
ncbi:MAG: glycosyltransferase family 9 protein [Oligoflexus sp.]